MSADVFNDDDALGRVAAAVTQIAEPLVNGCANDAERVHTCLCMAAALGRDIGLTADELCLALRGWCDSADIESAMSARGGDA